ncbi:hypothetical protein ACFVAF_37085 [Streptomyces sp. NPDC057596]|uniref:hypothetical protein n=1 Tax=Streptomyces sp. NPDC057596 TaxID=3346178 RepID=UPI00368C52E5
MTTEITEQTTPTAPAQSLEQDTTRASYARATALAARLVDQAQVLPDTVETRRELGTDTYGVRLHFGTGLAAGRGVLETAGIVDAEVTRDDVRDGVVWIEVRATVDGIPLIARALTNTADADQLLATSDTAEDSEATQPIPTVGTSSTALPVPGIYAVRPLTAVKSGA